MTTPLAEKARELTDAELLAEADALLDQGVTNPFGIIGRLSRRLSAHRDLRERVRKATEPWAGFVIHGVVNDNFSIQVTFTAGQIRALAALHAEVSEPPAPTPETQP